MPQSEILRMKFRAATLATLMLALMLLSFAPIGDSVSVSPGVPDQSPARSGSGMGSGHGFRYGAGDGTPGDNGMGHGQRPVPQAARHGQERNAQTEAQREFQRDPFDWNTTVRALRFRSYRRLFGKNILEHEKRQLIYSTILTNPGIDVNVLVDQTGINLHTLRYHLSYLVRMQKVTCVEQGGKNHFFENHGRFDSKERLEILFGRSPTTHNILSVIAAEPGITRGEIADRLGLAGPSVTRWMQRLLAEKMVAEIREGRSVRYFSRMDHGPLFAA